MKTIKVTKQNKVLHLILALSILTQYSCAEIFDDFFENGTENASVSTLVENFQANDGLSVDNKGFIYGSNFANFTGTEVLKVNPKTASVEVVVNELVAPTGNKIDKFGNIFIVNNVRRVEPTSNEIIGDVLKIDKDGNRTILATLPGFPSGIALDKKGNAYVSNFSFPGVHKITPEGEVTVYVEDVSLTGGVGIDFDEKGNLFVGNFSTGEVLKINSSKSVEVLATIPTVVENVVIGYITYFAGSIFATGIGEHVIYRISSSGEVSIFAGNGNQETVNGSLLESSFNTPNGITADKNKKLLYVSEGGEGALRVIKFK